MLGKVNVNIMLLAVDIGNTQTVIGVYENEDLVATWRLSTTPSRTSDEIRSFLTPLFHHESLDPAAITHVILASVVPPLTSEWRRAIQDSFQVEPLTCSAALAGSLFQTTYPRPAEIGADRVADAVAAKALYGAPVVVVDFGTATNIEVIDAAGNFVGGIIAPGLLTSAQTLSQRGAQLPVIELLPPEQVVGRSTVEAMRSGIVLGEADRVDGLLKRIFDELGLDQAVVVATGGLASVMAPVTQRITTINSELTLEGLRLIALQAKPAEGSLD